MKRHVTDYILYRWRYILGYTAMLTLIVSVLFVALVYVPGELRTGEMDASIKSASLSFSSIDPSMVINLPYHVIQRLSLDIFGATPVAIKLPSFLFALGTVAGFFFLVRLWFRANVAILATILAMTTSQFLFLSQDGTPHIMYSFLAVWLLLAATMVTRNKIFGTFWKVLVCVITATLLYVPLGIYLVLAVLTTMIFHPHIRYVIKKLPAYKVVLATVLGIAVIMPVIYASFIDTKVLKELLGIPTGDFAVYQNLSIVIKDLFGFSIPSQSYILRPFYSLGAFLLIAVGAYKLLTQKHTARSYIVIVWGLLLAPFVIFKPEMLTSYFVIASLLMTLGIAALIADWYKLFPRNPYARVAGLVPLSIVVLGIVAAGVMRYIDNYQYNPSLLSHYSKDLTLLDNTLDRGDMAGKKPQLMTTKEERAFYAMVSRYDKRFVVDPAEISSTNPIMITKARHAESRIEADPALIVTTSRAENADRFYVYNLETK